jgi:hypothetical protein
MLTAQDPCLDRVVKEAAVARDAALDAGASSKHAPKACRKTFDSADQTFDTLRLGKVKPNTDAAWKRASDALRKFTEALDCAPQRGGPR